MPPQSSIGFLHLDTVNRVLIMIATSSVTEEHGALRHILCRGPFCHTSLVTKRTVRVSRRDLPRGVGRGACHMYICIYVYMYICIYVYMYICVYVYMCICVDVYCHCRCLFIVIPYNRINLNHDRINYATDRNTRND